MFMGLTIANIGGVPAATWIGQHLGWRQAFAITAGLGVFIMLGLSATLPKGGKGQKPNISRELRTMTRIDVVLPMLTTVLGASAMFVLYTYITPILAAQTNTSNAFITLSLVIIGAGFTIGNWIGGCAADWSLTGGASVFLALLSTVMLLFPLLITGPVSTALVLFICGIAAFAIVPPLQMRVMQAASDAPSLASSINIGAFNVGNAIGAGLGGAAIKLGVSYDLVPILGGLTALVALALIQLSRRHLKLQSC